MALVLKGGKSKVERLCLTRALTRAFLLWVMVNLGCQLDWIEIQLEN
jgi:hypothetical protein